MTADRSKPLASNVRASPPVSSCGSPSGARHGPALTKSARAEARGPHAKALLISETLPRNTRARASLLITGNSGPRLRADDFQQKKRAAVRAAREAGAPIAAAVSAAIACRQISRTGKKGVVNSTRARVAIRER